MNVAFASPSVQGGVSDFTEKLLENLNSTAKHYSWSRENLAQFDLAFANDCIFLQYSGYGFAKRGAPLWLLRELQSRHKKTNKFGVFFHELYAMGSFWSSAFWLSPLQRKIARDLAEMSDFWMTNREGSAQWLKRYAGDKPHAVLPVFSNVGETLAYSSSRDAKAVVFGGAGLRLATYRAGGEALFAWAKRQSLEIHDVGPVFDDEAIASRLTREGVKIHGRLEPDEVSHVLADAMFGIVVYPLEYVAKSGVFAAYCAHGLCPILLSGKYLPADGLMAGYHYLQGVPDGVLALDRVLSMSYNAWNWYQPHRLSIHISTLHNLMATSRND